ncbi:porin [Bradyrhizobium sp. BR 1432]|uniref:porin n=1 Tax=Bradyrhizobium sp. BR 1432 TaxID=3447966 RepID=UPI003EE69990
MTLSTSQGVYTNGASRYNFESDLFDHLRDVPVAPVFQVLTRVWALLVFPTPVFVTGSGQELITTYGLNGAYTHNWDTRWNTAVFGAWAAVRYNNTAKGYICGAFVTTLALSSGGAGCNPDFNYAVVGTDRPLDPVKNLTFSAEFAYMMLDQKYASGSTVTLPLQAGIAKPSAAYELKDQNSLVLLLRAQRDW